MTKEKFKLIDKANVLHAACILFGHNEIGKEKFVEIVARTADEISDPICGEQQPSGQGGKEEEIINRAAKALEDEMYGNLANELKSIRLYPKQEWNDAERKQLYSDGYYSSRSNLALDFMHYLDEHRPEEKMCLSNGECAQLQEAFKNGDVETIVRYIIKYQQPAGWKPSKPQLAEGVYYIKDGQPVSEYEDGVEIDCLLIIGKYCRFYLSMKDLGRATFKGAQEKAAALGEGWRCPDSFEGRTIGKMSKEICEKAAKIGAEHFKEKGWFWTNELYDRWDACSVYFGSGTVGSNYMYDDDYVLALSAFQN